MPGLLDRCALKDGREQMATGPSNRARSEDIDGPAQPFDTLEDTPVRDKDRELDRGHSERVTDLDHPKHLKILADLP